VIGSRRGRKRLRLVVGDDWSEADHDVELMDAAGRTLVKARLTGGVVGMARLHALVGDQLGEVDGDVEVVVGIETDHGPWVQVLLAAGYSVFAVGLLRRGMMGSAE
jgi:hypothetical protein